MRKNSIIGAVITMVLLGCLALGILHLFALRFKAGDIYPVYSSLRSDPLGTRVFYESLKNIDPLIVRRNYKRLSLAAFEPRTTFFYLGAHFPDQNAVDREVVEAVDRLMRSGGRVVISFLPVNKKKHPQAGSAGVKKPGKIKEEVQRPVRDGGKNYRRSKEGNSNPPSESEAQPPGSKAPITVNKPVRKTMISLKDHWQIGFELDEDLPVNKDKSLDLSAVTTRADLPAEISWHTNLFFNPTDADWRIIYSCRDHPVLVERRFGSGSLVLSADSFFFSNEALWSERYPRLLSWLVGSSSSVVFDEAHLGMVRQPSVARLIRDYRFHWFFVALAVLAVLFVWKNAVYFVPPRQDIDGDGVDVVSEKDYNQALIALLRRNISKDRILEICRQQWELTAKKQWRIRDDTLQRMGRTIEGTSSLTHQKQDPVQEYRRICKIISEDRKHE